jgi:hypothetical protein
MRTGALFLPAAPSGAENPAAKAGAARLPAFRKARRFMEELAITYLLAQ